MELIAHKIILLLKKKLILQRIILLIKKTSKYKILIILEWVKARIKNYNFKIIMTYLRDSLTLRFNLIKLMKLGKVCLVILLMLIRWIPNSNLELLDINWVWNNPFIIIIQYIKVLEKQHLLLFRFKILRMNKEISFQISLLH